MADYNLGTAHGRIVIEYDDTGTKKAEASFNLVAARANWLRAHLRGAADSVREFASDFGSNMERVGNTSTIIAGVASGLTALAGVFTGFGTALTGLRSGAGILLSLAFGMDAIPNGARGFPRVIQQIILLSAGIAAIRGSLGILATLASRFALLAPFAPMFRNLADVIGRLALPIRIIAGVALAVAGLITGVRVATALAKAILSLQAAFGALYGAIGIINGVIGALTQLSGVAGLIPGAIFAAAASFATLAVGFNGLSKALKFVPPAAGGAASATDRMAKAAKQAARSIASAQRAVDEALQAQARTFRDTGRQIESAQRSLQDTITSAARANEDAVKRVARAQRDLGDALAGAARSAEDNARRVVEAQRNIGKTAEASARAVASASRGLTAAIKSEQSAQKGLNDARATAIQQMKDALELVNDLALDQEGAAIALIEAQNNLNKVNDDALSTELDKRKALYELNVAQERVNDTTEAQSKALEANNKAQEAGVDGAQVVIDAQERLLDAQQSLKDAQDEFARAGVEAAEANADAAQRLADAVRAANDDQVESARRVADAQEAVTEALRDQYETAQRGARDIADAQQQLALAEESAAEARADAAERVEDAYRRLAETQEDAAESLKEAAAAAAGAEDPINKLSPAAQALVRTIRGLKDEWIDLRNTVQEQLFRGAAQSVQELADIYFPLLKIGLSGIAREFNLAGVAAVTFFKSAQTQNDMAQGLELTRIIVSNLRVALGPLLEAFRDIGIVGLEALADLSVGVGDAAARFRDFIAAARESGRLREWIDGGIQGFRDLWGVVRDVAASIQLVTQGITGNDGSTFLATLAQGAASMRAFLESAQGQEALRQLGDFLRGMAERTLAILKVAFEQLGPVLTALQPFLEDLGRVFTDVIIGALEFVGPLLKGVADTLSFLSPVLAPILGFLFSLGLAWRGLIIAIQVLIPVISGLVTAFNILRFAWQILSAVFLANPWVLLIAAIIALVALIIYNWDTIWEYLQWIWGKIIEGVQWFGQLLYDYVVQPAIDIHDAWIGFWNDVGELFRSAMQLLIDDWVAKWNQVTSFLGDVDQAIRDLIGNLFGWLFNESDGSLKSIGQIWDEHLQWLQTNVEAAINWLLGFFGTNLEDLRGLVGRIINNITDFFWNMPTRIMQALAGLPGLFRDLAVNTVGGLWNGFVAQGRWLWNNIMNWARTYIPGPILDFLGIASPSKYFRDEIGKMIPAGLMIGIESMNGRVAQTSEMMAEAALTAARSTLAAGSLAATVPADFAMATANGGLISDAAALTRTNAAAAAATTVTTPTGGTTGADGEYATYVENLNLTVAGNLDPTNKLAWDQAMDNIREGIRSRERARA